MKKVQNKILLILGLILVLDGVLSILVAFPNSCYHACLNNSVLGQIGRIIRTLIGVFLIYESFYKKRAI